MYFLKKGMGQPGPSLGPDPMASRPILRVMSRHISPRCYDFDGSLAIMGRLKYFSIIINHEYYEHFLKKIRFKINIYLNNMLRLLAIHQIKHIY